MKFATKILLCFSWIFNLLPQFLRIFCGKLFGAFLMIIGFRKKIIKRNLEIATLKEKPSIWQIYRHFGLFSSETLSSLTVATEKLVATTDFMNVDLIDAALAKKKGLIIVTAHFGNWEHVMAAFAAKGYAVNVVVKKIKGVDQDSINNALRTRHGVRAIDKDKAPIQVYKALKKGEIVIMVLDQNSKRKEAVFADFLGTTAATYKSVAYFAYRTQAPVMAAWIFRQKDDIRHQLEMRDVPSIKECKKPTDSDLQEATQTFLDELMPFFDYHPAQWLWMHQRWKSRPQDDDSIY